MPVVRIVVVAVLAIAAAAAGFQPGAEEGPTALGLEDCVAQAVATGPDFRLSGATLAGAQAARDAVAAKNAFGLSSSAGLSRSVGHGSYTTQSGNTITVPTANASDSAQAALNLNGPLATSLGLAASQVIPEAGSIDPSTRLSLNLSAQIWDGYLGGRALGALRQADYSYAVAASQGSTARRQAIYSVKQAYYSLLAQQRQIDILRRSLETRTTEEARTRLLYDAAAASGIDLKQAEYNRSLAALDLRKGQSAAAASRRRLSALMGWPLERAYTVREVEALPDPPPEAADAVAQALAARPELRQLELQLAAGRVALDLAKGQYSPALSATGSATFAQDWASSRGTVDWSLGLQLSYPLIDSGTLDAQRRQAQYQIEAYEVQREQIAASVSTDIGSAVDALADLLDRVGLARSGLELAQAQYDLASTQFELGKGAYLDLLNASVALTAAEAALAGARSDAQLGDLALQFALGK